MLRALAGALGPASASSSPSLLPLACTAATRMLLQQLHTAATSPPTTPPSSPSSALLARIAAARARALAASQQPPPGPPPNPAAAVAAAAAAAAAAARLPAPQAKHILIVGAAASVAVSGGGGDRQRQQQAAASLDKEQVEEENAMCTRAFDYLSERLAALREASALAWRARPAAAAAKGTAPAPPSVLLSRVACLDEALTCYAASTVEPLSPGARARLRAAARAVASPASPIHGPLAVVLPEGAVYRAATPIVLERVVNEHLVGGRLVADYLVLGASCFGEEEDDEEEEDEEEEGEGEVAASGRPRPRPRPRPRVSPPQIPGQQQQQDDDQEEEDQDDYATLSHASGGDPVFAAERARAAAAAMMARGSGAPPSLRVRPAFGAMRSPSNSIGEGYSMHDH